jgi:hypothetical protein
MVNNEKKEINAFKKGVRFALDISREQEERNKPKVGESFNPFKVCTERGHKLTVLDVTPRNVKVDGVLDWREIVRLVCGRCLSCFSVALPKDDEVVYNTNKKSRSKKK